MTLLSAEDALKEDPIFPLSLYLSDFHVNTILSSDGAIMPEHRLKRNLIAPPAMNKMKSSEIPLRNIRPAGADIDLSWMDTSSDEENTTQTKTKNGAKTKKKQRKKKAKRRSATTSQSSTAATTAPASDSESEHPIAITDISPCDDAQAQEFVSNLSVDAPEFIPEAELVSEEWTQVQTKRKKGRKCN